MGLASWALGDNNPLSQYIADNRHKVHGAFAGLGQGRTFGQGLGQAALYAQQGGLLDDLDRDKREQEAKAEEMRQRYAETLRGWGGEYGDLAEAVLAGGIEPADAYMRAWERRYAPQAGSDITANQNDFLFAQQNGFQGTFEDWVRGDQRNPALGTTIYTGRDENGNIIPMQVSNDGSLVPTQLPSGIAFDPGAMNAERAYGTQVGTGRGKAEVAAPEAIATAQRTLTQIQQLKQDPGLWWSVGGMGWTPNMPGNPQAGTISRIEQLQGAAFLEAFESLKGGGQITEVEGAKATNAMARLQRSQSYEDFSKALSDLEEVINVGLQRAMRQGQGGSAVPPMGGASGGPAPSGRVLTYNPATGMLE